MLKLKQVNSTLKELSAPLIVFPVSLEPQGRNKKEASPRPASQEITLAKLGQRFGLDLDYFIKSNVQFEAKSGQSFALPVLGDRSVQEVLFVGAPERFSNVYDERQWYRRLGVLISQHVGALKVSRAALVDRCLNLSAPNLSALVEGALLARYRFERYRSKPAPALPALAELAVLTTKAIDPQLAKEGAVVCEATNYARDLINTPPKDCTPHTLMLAARNLARSSGMACSIMDRGALKRMGANLILAVASGSAEAPYLIRLTYRPRRARKVVTLVGKGVTFDSGGLSIKSGAGMESMKSDMSGAAAVLGVMKAIAILKPRVEVRAYIPTVENMINGAAVRPGDVITGLAGKSVEILNTDAEGRLILADALSLAEREGCDEIIELSTLTGAIVTALGDEYAGCFSSDDRLVSSISEHGAESGERFWRMPLAREYGDQLKSSVADLKNIGRGGGGSIVAALFLKEFVTKTPFVHIDIAGTAMSDGDRGFIKKGGVGFGVRTLVRYLQSI